MQRKIKRSCPAGGKCHAQNPGPSSTQQCQTQPWCSGLILQTEILSPKFINPKEKCPLVPFDIDSIIHNHWWPGVPMGTLISDPITRGQQPIRGSRLSGRRGPSPEFASPSLSRHLCSLPPHPEPPIQGRQDSSEAHHPESPWRARPGHGVAWGAGKGVVLQPSAQGYSTGTTGRSRRPRRKQRPGEPGPGSGRGWPERHTGGGQVPGAPRLQ